MSAGLPAPQIEEKGDFVDVALLRPIAHHVRTQMDDLSQIMPDLESLMDDYGRLRTITDDYQQLTHEQQRVLLALLDAHKLTRSIVMDVLQVEKSKAFDVLQALLAFGLIARQGNGRATVYVLAPKT